MHCFTKFTATLIITLLLLNINLSAANLSPLHAVLKSSEYSQSQGVLSEEKRQHLERKFERARRQPLIDATQNAAIGIIAQLGAASAVGYIAGNEGSSLSWYAAIGQVAAQIWDVGKAWITYFKHGKKDTLSRNEWAVMRSISDYPPSVLEAIATAGEGARTDIYQRGVHISRLNHLVQLRLNTPLPSLSSDVKVANQKKLVQDFYDLLVKTYDPDLNSGLQVLALELATFVGNVEKGTPYIQYISISGLPGVGKTETTKTVSEILKTMLGEKTVHIYQAILQNGSEIEGNNGAPSMLLNATGLARSDQNARGLFVVMDEGATHLNQHVDSAKRAFNNKTQISGGHFLGVNKTFDAMPTIVFILSNDPINDTALASRMTQIHFERPTVSALEIHAKRTIKELYAAGGKDPLTKEEIIKIAQESSNFRDVGDRVKSLIAKKMLEKETTSTVGRRKK